MATALHVDRRATDPIARGVGQTCEGGAAQRRQTSRLRDGHEVAVDRELLQASGADSFIFRVDGEVPHGFARLRPHHLVVIFSHDRGENIDVVDPGNRLAANRRVGVLAGDIGEQFLGAVLLGQAAYSGNPREWIVTLPFGLGSELVEQTHRRRRAVSLLDRSSKIMHTRDRNS